MMSKDNIFKSVILEETKGSNIIIARAKIWLPESESHQSAGIILPKECDASMSKFIIGATGIIHKANSVCGGYGK